MFENNKIIKTKKKSTKPQSKGLILPLYFGWQIRIILERVKDLKAHIVGPFKKYWQYMTAVLVLIIITSTFLILKQHQTGRAATYYWTQNSWDGGASTTDIAVHNTDNDNWDKYQSADSNLDFSTSGEVKIASTTQAISHTLTADFSNGTSTGVITTDDEIKLDLP